MVVESHRVGRGTAPAEHDVDYVYWRNILHPVPTKCEVSLTLRDCVQVAKWSRTFKLLKSAKVC
jgi:hypothetical protein